MRAIRYAATFWRDANAEIRYAIEHGEERWSRQLAEDIVDVERLLTDFPDAGRELDRIGETTLRKMKLRRCPFLVWYTTDPQKVVIARLFHVRQLTPEPRLP